MRERKIELDKGAYLKSRHSSLTAPIKFLTDMMDTEGVVVVEDDVDKWVS